MRWPSISLILSGLFIGYVLHSIWVMGQLFIPPTCHKKEFCMKSYLYNKPRLQLHLFTSVQPNPTLKKETVLNDVVKDFDYFYPMERILTITLPEETTNNGTLFLHIFLSPLRGKQDYFTLSQEVQTVHVRVRLTQYHIPEAAAFQLLQGQSSHEKNSLKHQSKISSHPKRVSHIRSHVTFNILTDTTVLPVTNVPPELARFIKLTPSGQFLPVMQYDFLNNRLRDLVPVDKSAGNITLSYVPIGIGKFRLMQHLQNALHSLITFGFSEKDIDEVKSIFADTNLYLLSLTIFVSAIHLLFDFLAFKHDVSFWRHRDTFAGLSSRTVAWRAFSHSVIFLYLLDENTSLLVLIPAGVATLIEVWKLQKVVRVDVVLHMKIVPIPHFSCRGSTDAEQHTQQLDAESMRYLSYLLYPLCLGGAVYSLLFLPHKSWFSWSIHSLVNGVYAFGFLFMLPQLFVNYKLKSVAHLPWRAFMYKAFNTFIDDLFAFIITMPTAHRVACFRDDIIFLIYLYQRWLYPVDKQRINEDQYTEEVTIKKNK